MTSELRFLTDRTTIETDWACGMKRWWYKEEGGTGIVPKEEAEYYRQGRQLHADYAAVAAGGDPVAIVKRVIGEVDGTTDVIALEHAWWHAGMVYAFAKYILPRYLANYRPLMIEKELVLNRAPLHIACTGDLVLIGIEGGSCEGSIIVIDYKSVRWVNQGWVNHWPYAVQMLINPKAVEEAIGLPVTATYVIGVQKPSIRNGRAMHPYTYAYSDGEDKWQSEWHKVPWFVRPLWERGGADRLIEWVEQLGDTTAIELHPTSAPIVANDRMLDQLIEERTDREADVARVREDAQHNMRIRRRFFESRFNECRPTIGDVCPYLAACHNAIVNADPIGSGLYVARTPHHDLEWLEKEGE